MKSAVFGTPGKVKLGIWKPSRVKGVGIGSSRACAMRLVLRG
jgi:hypothetical protein